MKARGWTSLSRSIERATAANDKKKSCDVSRVTLDRHGFESTSVFRSRGSSRLISWSYQLYSTSNARCHSRLRSRFETFASELLSSPVACESQLDKRLDRTVQRIKEHRWCRNHASQGATKEGFERSVSRGSDSLTWLFDAT